MGVSSVAMLLRCTGKGYRHKKVTTVQNTSLYPMTWICPKQPSFVAPARACSLLPTLRIEEQGVEDYF